LRTNQGTGPSGVLLDHQFIPDTDLVLGLHPNLYGPVCTVLWEGAARAAPYPD
jgi:hypothetical protein